MRSLLTRCTIFVPVLLLAACDHWKYIGQSGGDPVPVYLDTSRTDENGTKRSVWLLYDAETGFGRSYAERQLFDCKTGEHTTEEMVYYTERKGGGEKTHGLPMGGYTMHILPGSILEVAAREVCPSVPPLKDWNK